MLCTQAVASSKRQPWLVARGPWPVVRAVGEGPLGEAGPFGPFGPFPGEGAGHLACATVGVYATACSSFVAAATMRSSRSGVGMVVP